MPFRKTRKGNQTMKETSLFLTIWILFFGGKPSFEISAGNKFNKKETSKSRKMYKAYPIIQGMYGTFGINSYLSYISVLHIIKNGSIKIYRTGIS